MKPDIELHIEELVLYGFSSGRQELIAQVVEREITRLLEEKGWPADATASLQVANLVAGSFTLQPTAGAESTGAAIASTVYNGITK